MCSDDAACPSGETCACHGSAYSSGGNTCVPGNCRVDSDCGAGGYCSPTEDVMSCGGVGGYYCHTAQDRCVNDSDCADGGFPDVCAYSTSAGYWECAQQSLCP
jgi:Cys-rich repeat protein